jgi:hypothetical protein
MGGMARNDSPTLRQLHVPVALVIGGARELVRVVEEAAVSAQVLVAECTVGEATNAAAEMRPLVMIMSEDVYAFDPDSFEALALDVRSQVLTVPPEGVQAEELKAKLKSLMLEAEELRPSWSSESGEP